MRKIIDYIAEIFDAIRECAHAAVQASHVAKDIPEDHNWSPAKANE